MFDEAAFDIQSGSLVLEGAIHTGKGDVVSIVMHPHPQYGGDMHNPVVVGLCRTLASLGTTTLRFNTRGTGRSEGAFDDAPGERGDARAAIAALRDLRPECRLVLAGYSFGALICASVAAEAGANALVLVSPPVSGASLALTQLPTLVVAGEYDRIAAAGELRRFVSETTRLTVISGADHGWSTGLRELLGEVEAFLKPQLSLMAG